MKYRNVVYALVVGIGLVNVFFTAPAGAVSAGGFGGRPANPDPNNPRTQSIFIYTLDRSETKQDQILLKNNSDSPVTMNVYATDGVVTNTGAYSCRQASEPKKDLGAWIKIDQAKVTLQPGEELRDNFSVTLPSNADVGEHNACIAFEDVNQQGQPTGGNVILRTRQAIRMAVTVPGDLKREISLETFTFGGSALAQQYDLAVNNKGNVSADVDTRVYLEDLWGNEIYTNGGSYPILANQTLNQTFRSEKQMMFGGWYYTHATAKYDTRPGTFGVADEAHVRQLATDKQLVFLWPTTTGWAIIIIIIALLGMALYVFIRRRRARAVIQKTWKTVTIHEATTIEQLAREYGVSWKRIARANRIKPPYTVESGRTLLLPPIKTGQ